MDKKLEQKITWWARECCKGNVVHGGRPRNPFLLMVEWELDKIKYESK